MTINLIITMLICTAIGICIAGVIDGAAWRISHLGDRRLKVWTFLLLMHLAFIALRIKLGYLV